MDRNGKLTVHARRLRKAQTKEEALLWYNFLREYPLRFHRQYVIGNYIADFYCHKAKLVVELDGSQHFESNEMQKDAERTAYLQAQGLQVLRFSNSDVLQKFSAVCEKIHSEVLRIVPETETKLS